MTSPKVFLYFDLLFYDFFITPLSFLFIYNIYILFITMLSRNLYCECYVNRINEFLFASVNLYWQEIQILCQLVKMSKKFLFFKKKYLKKRDMIFYYIILYYIFLTKHDRKMEKYKKTITNFLTFVTYRLYNTQSF
jgi:hypothetical protein